VDVRWFASLGRVEEKLVRPDISDRWHASTEYVG
jgi:hypothetical protein